MAVRRLRAGAPGGRKVVDLHMRQVERDRDVARGRCRRRSRRLRRRQAVDQRAEVHRRPDLGGTRRAPRRCARRAPAPRRRRCGSAIRQPAATMARRPSSIQLASGQSLSSREVPWMKTQVSAPHRLPAARRGGEAEVRRAAGAVAERARRQLARAVERMDVRLDAQIAWSTSQRAGHSWLAPSVRLARPKRGAAREARDQRRLGQPLQVEHRVVALRGAGVAEGAHLGRASPRPPAPCASAAAGTRSPRRCRRPGAPAARSPARRPSRSRAADGPRGCRRRPASHARRRRATTA